MKTRHFIFSLIFLLGCISCSDDDPGPQEINKGDMVGSVQLFDEGKNPVDNADMTVRIDGLDIFAKTDAEGKFILKDVPFGIYNLIYEKSGFGTYKMFNLGHSKYSPDFNTLIQETPHLGQVSSTKVTSLSVEVIGNDVVLTVTTDPPGSVSDERYVRYYYGSTNWYGEGFVISSDSNLSFFHSDIIATQSNPQVITIPREVFLAGPFDSPFTSGEEIFLRVFGDSYWGNFYSDPYLEKNVRPNMNPSAADQVSFYLP